MKKNYLYSLLVATSLSSMMSCAHATDLTQDEDQRPLFTRAQEVQIMIDLEKERAIYTSAVARQIGADNARIVVEEERDDLLLVLVRKDEEIVGLHQAADRIRADFERQIQELNQTVATLAARALETENNRRAEVQARQLAELDRDTQAQAGHLAQTTLFEVQQERDAFAREIAQLRSEGNFLLSGADLRRQLAQSESARDLEARERRAAEEQLAQMEAARVEAERVLRLQNQENKPV
jgi:hypothetical protein